jgi:hypothetical protein
MACVVVGKNPAQRVNLFAQIQRNHDILQDHSAKIVGQIYIAAALTSISKLPQSLAVTRAK